MARAILFLVPLNFLLLFLFLPSSISTPGSGVPADSELFYCVDWDCQEFISRGKTLLNYAGRTERHLSFRQNEDIKILSKSIDEKGTDWVGMVRRKIGLVPKTMVREDQMGKHPSKFQYPFNLLPLWSQVEKDSANEAKPDVPPPNAKVPQPEQDAQAEDDNSTVVENVQEEDSSSSEVVDESDSNTVVSETVENSSSVADNAEQQHSSESEGTILPNDFEDPPPQSVEPIPDTPEPPQTTVMSDELQKQENVEPTETVDHEMPEIPEATAVNVEQKEAEQHQEAIEPTKSSTLDQLVAATTEVVVEPSEIVDLKDPQDGESQNEPVVFEESSSEVPIKIESEHQPEFSEQKESETPLPPQAVEPEPLLLKVNEEVVQLPEEPIPAEPQTLPEPLVVDKQEQADSFDSKVVQSVEKPSEVNVVAETTSESPALQRDLVDEIKETEKKGFADSQKEEVVESTTPSPVPDIPAPEKSETPEPESAKDAEKQEESATESIFAFTSGWFGSSEPEQPATPSPESTPPEIQKSADESAKSPQEEVSGGTFPGDDDTMESGSFASLFQETAKLTESNSAGVEEPKLDYHETKVESESHQPEPEHIETTSELPIQLSQAMSLEELVPETPSTEPAKEELIETTTASPVQVLEEVKDHQPQSEMEPELTQSEDDHHHHHHHHHHHEHKKTDDSETSSSFIVVVKHLSSTLLSFLPEHLQDTILDVDDALVFTGIIALTLVSICVPYFLIEGFFSVRPLKKKVVELNKSLWKVSTAYENQQEEFESYKKKALAYDEDKKRVEQLEYELLLLKKLEAKQKEQVSNLKKELKSSAQVAEEVQSLVETTMDRKKKALEEREKLKTTVASLKEALRRTTDELQEAQAEGSSAVMDLELARQSNETLCMKVDVLEKEVSELKSKLVSEVDRRRVAEDERDETLKSKTAVDNELSELRKICHKYEETVSDLNIEIGHKENELSALKDTLRDDSPLVDIAEVRAKLVNAEEEAASLQSKVETFTLENTTLSRNLKEATSSLSTIQKEKDEALNRLQVLEAWFKEKEEELRKAVERYEAEKNIRGKDKDDLVRMIEEKTDETRDLNSRIEALKEEFEETKQQHKNEIRALETKSHEHWLSLCQTERKFQDARKEAEFLRQTLTALTKEKESGGDELNGEVPLYPLITPDMVPMPLPDDSPSYYGLGDDFIPPPPLPLDEEREPHRPAPLGRLSPYSDLDDNILSPIRSRGRDEDYSRSDDDDSSASDSPRRNRRSPRGGWVDVPRHDRDRDRDDRRQRRGHSGPRASSPISNKGFNL